MRGSFCPKNSILIAHETENSKLLIKVTVSFSSANRLIINNKGIFSEDIFKPSQDVINDAQIYAADALLQNNFEFGIN